MGSPSVITRLASPPWLPNVSSSPITDPRSPKYGLAKLLVLLLGVSLHLIASSEVALFHPNLHSIKDPHPQQRRGVVLPGSAVLIAWNPWVGQACNTFTLSCMRKNGGLFQLLRVQQITISEYSLWPTGCFSSGSPINVQGRAPLVV